MSREHIKEGDIVTVNIHNICMTLLVNAKVLHMPCATGDSWIFEDAKTGCIHYISEGCTVTKCQRSET